VAQAQGQVQGQTGSAGKQLRDIRADQYGIRTLIEAGGYPIKFEIVLEGRIELEKPDIASKVCGITSLSPIDMLASKLLANSDRGLDSSVFSRDLIDIAMMQPSSTLLNQAIAKATGAYGASIVSDLRKCITRIQTTPNWLERCMQAMVLQLPKKILLERIAHIDRCIQRYT
jgi:hypothetical protein